jgi:hypothetical protein
VRRWEPNGDVFGLIVLGLFAGLLIVLIRTLAVHCH